MKKFSDYINELNKATITKVTSTTRVGNSVCSMGVVYSTTNGKRVTFSKALSAKLELEDTIDVIPHSDAGVVHIGKNLKGLPGVSTCTLKGDDKKICYDAGLANILATEYGIDFKNHVSHSFQNIAFDVYNEAPMATVTLNKDINTAYETDDGSAEA